MRGEGPFSKTPGLRLPLFQSSVFFMGSMGEPESSPPLASSVFGRRRLDLLKGPTSGGKAFGIVESPGCCVGEGDADDDGGRWGRLQMQNLKENNLAPQSQRPTKSYLVFGQKLLKSDKIIPASLFP